MKIATSKERIIKYLNFRNISLSKFYENTGLKRGLLDSDKLHQNITDKNIATIIASYHELNLEWLLTGKGSMLKSEETLSSKESGYKKPFMVPLIPIEAIAGFPDNDTPGTRYEDCDLYAVPEFEKSGFEFVIRVSGSSMYPKYSSGDILACRKVKDILFFQWGKVYVIDSSQGPLVKRVFEHDNPELLLLVSENKEKYPPFSLPKSDVRSLSLVLGVIRME
jgi:phage repressor protein C with HTH and peptisase S24 domain